MAEIAFAKGGLEGLFRRPKTSYENLEKETVSVAPRSSDLIYIRSCSECKFSFHGKAAKCVIESSSDLQVEFEEPLIAGTLEMISSKNVTIFINPQDRLPTISADGCTNVHLHLYEPRAIGSIYTVDCSNIVVHFQPPHKLEYVLDIPEDRVSQYVSEFRGGKMTVDKVIREGAGYATTVEKKELADKRQKELQSRFEEYVLGLLNVSLPGSKEKTPQAVTGKTPEAGKTPQAVTGKTPEAAKTPQAVTGKSPPKDELSSKGGDDNEAVSPGNASSDDPLAAALRAKRGELKPTETVERHLPVVGTGGGGGGGFNPAIKDEAEKREFFDSEEELTKKLDRTAEWVRQSKHAIVFTGAGISTSAGIPDFRSGMKTVLPTGPGVWELRAHAAAPSKSSHIVPLLKALPTQTHMAIVKLHEASQVKFTISQNIDGLHRRSGLGPTQLAELHGNMNLETCQKCHRQYLRDFETREAAHVHDHRTDRVCDDPTCRGTLEDSIINFGEMLPKKELEEAFIHARAADLCIVLGSSLRVRPACQVPEVVKAVGGKVVICNLQKIPQFPQDNKTVQVFCKCDDFITGLMQRLDLEIPNFVLRRRARISAEKKEDSCEVTVTGLDVDEDAPYSFIKSVSARHGGKHYEASVEPLLLKLPADLDQLVVTVHFHGHYGEPSLAIQYLVSSGARVYQMGYDVIGRTWTVE